MTSVNSEDNRDRLITRLIERLEAANRIIDLYNRYGQARFGDDWWPGDAGTHLDMSREEVDEILAADTSVPTGLRDADASPCPYGQRRCCHDCGA